MSHAHDFLTRQVIGMLSPEERAVWQPAAAQLVAEYCWYPDWWISPDARKRDAARPYVPITQGVPFHYLPANPVEYNNWRVGDEGRLVRLANQPNLHWLHFLSGYTRTFSAALDALRQGRVDEAARHVGVMLHVVEDAGSLAHVQEGMDGTDAFALTRLLRPPGTDPAMSVSAILSRRDDVGFANDGYRPRLLGTRVAEIVFQLYARFAAMIRENRFELVPIVQDIWAGREQRAQARLGSVNRRMCEVGADLLHTLTAVARQQYAADEFERLACVPLERMQPIHRPYYLPPYGSTPIIVNSSMASDGRLVPLRLRVRGEVATYARGLGTGCHAEYLLAYDLPPDVYDTFSSAVGLHAELGRSGAIEVEVRLAGQRRCIHHFDDNHPAGCVEVAVAGGGLLELVVRDTSGDWGNAHNHVVWGEPRLIRRSEP